MEPTEHAPETGVRDEVATAEREGVRLAYERAGPAGAPTVVLVEGLGYGRWMWQWQRDALEGDYDVVVPDNRGTGDSGKPEGPYTVGEMAADLDAVLADAGVERAHVVGASMGGMIALQYVLDFDRAASLALLCTSPGGDDAAPTPDETLARMFGVPDDLSEREAITYKMQPAMTEEFWTANQELVDDIVDWRLASDAPDPAREAQGAAVEAFDASDRLGEIEVPALVLHGTADRVLPVANADLLADGLPDADLELVEGGSHLFFIEQADAVNDRLASFLADHA
jgi:pimeloyl-ACP methyl ester carboxylesterase